MRIDIRPVLASLRKHKISSALLILEFALACAVFCIVLFMISQRVSELRMTNMIDTNDLVDISVTGVDPGLVSDDIPRDVNVLRAIPGVAAVAATSTVPFGKGYSTDRVSTQADGKNAAGASRFMFTDGGPSTLGMRLIQGRFFNNTDYIEGSLGKDFLPTGHVVLITASLARHMWPDQAALGKQIWLGDADHSYTIVGVVQDVARPNSSGGGAEEAHYATFFPVRPNDALTDYIVRCARRDRERVLRAAMSKLQTLSPNAVIAGHTLTEIREHAFAGTRSMIWMLVFVSLVMLAVTAFGIVGLTSFWVGQRRHQIGIRRAVGATRMNILAYFQVENFLLSCFGVLIGLGIVVGVNVYLAKHAEATQIAWYYPVVSMFSMWLLGQLSVLGPALRAANVPPALATRQG